MTRTEFNTRYAATADNWFEPETLDRVNDLAFDLLRNVDADDPNVDDFVSAAFDRANNAL